MREALQRLVSDGIVRAEPNHGFYVATFSARDIAEIYDLARRWKRWRCASRAPRLSVEEIDEAFADLERLEGFVREAKTDDQWLTSTRDFLEADRAFSPSSGRTERQLTAFGHHGRTLGPNRRLPAAGLFRRSWLEVALVDHRRIISALRTGQFDEAEQHLNDHIEHVKRFVIDLADPE